MKTRLARFAKERPLSIVTAMVVAVASVLVACNHDRVAPTASARPAARSNQLVGGQAALSTRRRPGEDRFVQLSNEIPGFAGYTLSPQHELVVRVKDTTTAHTATGFAVSALSAHLSRDAFGLKGGNRPSSIRIIPADYDFQTLAGYRDFATDSLLGAVSGVVMVDLDEAINRVTIGTLVSQPSAQAQASERLVRHGIPLQAIHFIAGLGMQPTGGRRESNMRRRRSYYDLADATPVYVSAGFAFQNSAAVILDCTIGPVVTASGVSRFVSASHCSDSTFYLQGDTLRTLGGQLIGHEVADPGATFTNGYGLVRDIWHRSSDAAMFSYDTAYTHTQGFIGRPITRQGSGTTYNTTVDSSQPWLFIIDTVPASSITVGLQLDHIGAGMGWFHGAVAATCFDYILNKQYAFPVPAIEVYCADNVQADVYKTDSGGPVFVYDGFDGAALAGIVSATDCMHNSCFGLTGSPGLVFSTWSAVTNDLGNLNPLINTTVSALSDSGYISSGEPVISWTPVSTTNTSATTQYHIYQSTWDASTMTWLQQNQYIGSVTSGTSYTDASAPWSVSSVMSGNPDPCDYSGVSITVVAYNQGIFSVGPTMFYLGPHNGSGPAC
jgi:hypothetical protein